MMRWYTLLCFLVALTGQADAVFLDDAFHVDYHQALLGVPLSHNTFFHRPQISSNASLLYTISGKAVVGAVNPKDGSLLWRQMLAERPTQNATKSFLLGALDGKVISAYGRTVTSWDALDGRIEWSHNFPQGYIILGVQAVPGQPQDIIVLANKAGAETSITRIIAGQVETAWQHHDRSGDEALSISSNSDSVFYISKSTGVISSGKLKVTLLKISNGAEIRHYTTTVGAETAGVGIQYVSSCSSSPFIASIDRPYSTLKFNLLGHAKSYTLNIDQKSEEVQGASIHQACGVEANPHFLLHIWTKTKHWADVFHIDLHSGEARKAYSLSATQESSNFAASHVGKTVYFTRLTETEVSVYSSESHGLLGRWQRQKSELRSSSTSYAQPHAAAEVVTRGKSGVAIRVAETSSAGEWTLIRNGETQWTRPEMLASVVLAVWAEGSPPAELAAELEAEISINPLVAYFHRLKRHADDLTYLAGRLRDLPRSILHGSSDSTSTAETIMIGRTTVLVATSQQEVIALDAVNSGIIRWRQDISHVVPPQIAVISMSLREKRITAILADGSFVVLGLENGEIIEHSEGTVPMTRIVELGGHPDSTYVKVASDGTPKLALDLAPSTATEGNALVTISEDGKAMGWTAGQSLENTWIIAPKDARIVDAVARPRHDPVASIGKVLGDRSVLYKYLSPNLALLTSISTVSDVLTMYLIDSITGAVLHTAAHGGVDLSAPVASVMSENWLVYSFTSRNMETGAISSSLIVSELFESDIANSRGPMNQQSNFSSFAPGSSTKPHVLTQAFTIAEPISHMAVTQTSQGITVRQVLCTLPNSGAIVGIPRYILDPRRPVGRDPTALEMEEGLLRYSPILDLDPKMYLTHTREVLGIHKVLSSPTLLESTSLVFGYGHDIFGTRVNPSMAFDVLDKGFKKMQLILTVVALWIGVMVLAPMVRKRQVEGRWKG